ncbi:MAG: PDZ domain-containing protein [Kiritimatiellae bacterium]|nr:PDZ domain-containing protein [Kiritimatiellia bacterium]
MRNIFSGVLAWGLGMAAAANAAWWGGSDDRAQVVRAIARVYPALVRVEVVSEEASGGRMEKERGSGSGTIISSEGHVLTNHHVAGKATRLICRLADGREIPAELVGTDALADIAVLRLDLTALRPGERLPVAEFADSREVKVGDAVLAMGSPGGLNQSVTRGIASNTALLLPRGMQGKMQLDGEDVGSLVRWIAHDAQIFPGNSGGPLVNMRGQIIGVNEVGVAGLGGAIPGNLARQVADEIIAHGHVRRSWTGLLAQPRLKGSDDTRGALIGGVLPESPGAAAGVQPGDILLEFDGTETNVGATDDLPVFNALVLGTPVGRTVPMRVRRGNEVLALSLTTTVREPAQPPDREMKDWGLTVRDVTWLMMIELKRSTTNGVFVSSIRVGGPCDITEPDMEDGDIITRVNDTPVPSVAALAKLTSELCEGRASPLPVTVEFERNQRSYLAVARIGGERPAENPTPSRRPEFPVVLQPVNQDLARRLALPVPSAARVAFVIPGRSADRAGFRAGDILVSVDGDPIRAPKQDDINILMQTLRQYRIGATLPFDIIRDGKPMNLSLVLEEAADTAEEPARYTDMYFEFTVREMLQMDRVNRQLPDDVRGVLIDQMERASDAQLAGVRPGDLLLRVDGEPTPDVPSAERALKAAVKERRPRVVFFIRRGVVTQFLEVEPQWNGRSKSPAESDPESDQGAQEAPKT